MDLVLTAEDLADPFPEFRLWNRSIPFLSPGKSALIVERLRRHAARSANGTCIEWGGARNNHGYGKLNFRMPGGRHAQEYVHRLSWFLKTGREMPEGYEVSHRCENRCCFNPECIEDEPIRVNRQRAMRHTHAKRMARLAEMAVAA